jgi:hypothetical protein
MIIKNDSELTDNDVKEIVLRSQLENIVTLIVTGAVILGLALIFKSWFCLWGLVILLNLNSIEGHFK